MTNSRTKRIEDQLAKMGIRATVEIYGQSVQARTRGEKNAGEIARLFARSGFKDAKCRWLDMSKCWLAIGYMY